MYPLPENCTVVVLVQDGKIQRVATNVDPKINVEVTNDLGVFAKASSGQPFNVPYQEPK